MYFPEQNDSASPTSKDSNAYNYNGIQRWTREQHGFKMDIVEVSGFLKNESVEHDAGIVAALSAFLKRDSPDRIPTILFITARLDNQELESFSKTLRRLMLARSLLTDCACSNVVLLLTHSDAPDVKDHMLLRSERYQEVFTSIFKIIETAPREDLALMAVGNSPLTTQHLQDSFKNAQLCDSEFKLLNKFASSNIMEKSTVPYSYQSLKVDELIASGEINRIRKVIEHLSSETGGTAVPNFMERDINEELVFHSASHYNKSIVVGIDIMLESAQTSMSLTVVHNCIHPNCAITLATGKSIAIADCLVGDRVLGLNNHVGVITKICKIYKGQRVVPDEKDLACFGCLDCGDKGFMNLCMVYVKGLMTATTEQNETYLTAYQKANRTFLPNKFQVDIQKLYLANMRSLVYYLEVDGGTGTFIADGFVRACKEKVVLKNVPLL